MNWKELDEDEQHPIKDVMILLRDVPINSEPTTPPEELVKLKNDIDLHVGQFKSLVNEVISKQRKLNALLTESEDVLQLMKRLRNSAGYDKILEGVDEYTASIDIENLTEEFRKATNKVNEYREAFKSLRDIEKFTCSVCLEAMCDTFLDPCGHTVCQDCASRVDKKCPYCRGTIFKAKKMIFS